MSGSSGSFHPQSAAFADRHSRRRPRPRPAISGQVLVRARLGRRGARWL